LILHHGDIKIETKLIDALNDVNTWCSDNPDELVMLYISHFEGDNAENITKGVIQTYDYFETEDVKSLANLTVGETKKYGSRGNSSCSIVVVYDHMDENYNDTITCYGYLSYLPPSTFVCWKLDYDSYPKAMMMSYLNDTSKEGPHKDGTLHMI